ncbi:MAG: phosphate acyltransferase PlsX [Elusimicrobia bacterium]|nr:phosphate acyltransferase PlsX [Elusimicrobiota bacterium]
MTKIALDVMGGDNAPYAQINGAVAAIDKVSSDIYLVGDEGRIREILNGFRHPRLKIIHASQVICMDDKAASSCRKYPDSSLMVGMRFIKGKSGAAFISAGNSGAVMASAVMVLERIPKILRPAIAVIAKGVKKPFVLLDAGANTNCSWRHLVQFAVMGSIIAGAVFRIKNPKVALLSNGSEDVKGPEAVVKANRVLRESDLYFVGNIEGGDVLSGICDCIVCDGFVGNAILKFAEGFAGIVKKNLSSSSGGLFSKLGKKFAKGFAKKFFKKFDYSEYGASILAGLKGNVLITHGIADEKTIANAIIAAESEIEGKINLRIAEKISGYESILSPDKGEIA